MSLRSQLEAGKFVVTTEIGPLKGTDITEVEEVAGLLKGKIDGANATDQQSAVMRLGSLATCHILKQKGLPKESQGGFFEYEGHRVNVSKGIGTSRLPVRLFCRPEVTVFDISAS